MAARKRRTGAIGVVYFVEAEGCGLIKIGFTERPFARRFGQLRAQSPVSLRGLGTIKGGIELERALHERFAGDWSHGEWFRATVQLRPYVASESHPWTDGKPRVARPIISGLPKVQSVREWADATMLTCGEETRSAAEWCRIKEQSELSLRRRVQDGIDPERILRGTRTGAGWGGGSTSRIAQRFRTGFRTTRQPSSIRQSTT